MPYRRCAVGANQELPSVVCRPRLVTLEPGEGVKEIGKRRPGGNSLGRPPTLRVKEHAPRPPGPTRLPSRTMRALPRRSVALLLGHALQRNHDAGVSGLDEDDTPGDLLLSENENRRVLLRGGLVSRGA